MQSFPIQKRFVQGPDFIELTPGHIEQQLKFADAHNVQGFIIMHPSSNTPYPDLSFLPTETIRGLHISFEAAKELSLINKCHNLEYLSAGPMSYPNEKIDLENFPLLRILNINWNTNYKSIEKLKNIVRLTLWKYKPKSRNLIELQNWKNLVYVRLTQPGVDCLDGLQNLPKLKELALLNVRSLRNFFSKQMASTFHLQELGFSACPNFNIDTIPSIPTLKLLSFSQAGKIETLKHLLSKFSNLETLGFTQSELLDGNLHYMLEHPSLKKVTIDHKKHYSIKEKDIQKILDEKNRRPAG